MVKIKPLHKTLANHLLDEMALSWTSPGGAGCTLQEATIKARSNVALVRKKMKVSTQALSTTGICVLDR